MPARQPVESGGVRSRPSLHDEHVGAGALAQRADGVGEDGLVGPALVGVRERDHVLGVGVVFAPATALRSLRTHGTTTTLVTWPATRSRGPRPRRPSRASSARPEPSGPTPPVTVMRSRPEAARRPPSDLGARRPQLVVRSADVQPEHRGRRRRRRRWRRRANGSPPTDLHRLEHAVADGDAVVERRLDPASSPGVEHDRPPTPRSSDPSADGSAAAGHPAAAGGP